MTKKQGNRTSVLLKPEDQDAIQRIKAFQGLETDSSAIRYALRRVDRLIRKQAEKAKGGTINE